MAVVGEIQASQSPTADELILGDLVEIKHILVELEKLINSRFDRLESIMETYHRETLDAVRLVINISSYTAEQATALRAAAIEAEKTIREVQDDIHDNALAMYNNQYLEKRLACVGAPLTDEMFRTCIGFFYAVAVGWSTSPPFIIKPRPTLPTPSQLSKAPNTFTPYLGTTASDGAGLAVPPNRAVWLNGAMSLVAIIEANEKKTRTLKRRAASATHFRRRNDRAVSFSR